MPCIWGDRVAGLAHHLLAHIGDHYTPIQLLKTPNSEQKKYKFHATQLGKLPNTSRSEQERTHTCSPRGASQLSLCLDRRPSPTSAVIGRWDLSQALHWSRCWWFHPLGRMNLIWCILSIPSYNFAKCKVVSKYQQMRKMGTIFLIYDSILEASAIIGA